jgi:hypothetical protein
LHRPATGNLHRVIERIGQKFALGRRQPTTVRHSRATAFAGRGRHVIGAH